MNSKRLIISAGIFTALAIASRLTFRMVETRWQIVALWIVAALVQFLVKPMFARRPSPTIFAIDMACIAVACAAVKWAIEGHAF